MTLEELGRIPLAEAGFTETEAGARTDEFVALDSGYVDTLRRLDGGTGGAVSLEDYVYLVLFPAMLRFPGDGTCSIRLTRRGGRG